MSNHQQSHMIRKSKERLDLMGGDEEGSYCIEFQRDAEVAMDFFKWRRQIIKKFYRIGGTYDVQDKTVEASIWMIDRISLQSKTSMLNDSSEYEKFAMACLSTAIKAHEPKKFVTPLAQELSRNFESTSAMEDLEVDVLLMLDFKTSPPTATSFVHGLVEVVPAPMLVIPGSMNSMSAKEAILELSAAQIREAVCEPLQVSYKPSWVAFAAVLNATKCTLPVNRFTYLRHIFANGLSLRTMTEDDWSSLEQLQQRLASLLENSVLETPQSETILGPESPSNFNNNNRRVSFALEEESSSHEYTPRSNLRSTIYFHPDQSYSIRSADSQVTA